jgi:hypothetical protein
MHPRFGYWPQMTQIFANTSENYRDSAIHPQGEGRSADKHL